MPPRGFPRGGKRSTPHLRGLRYLALYYTLHAVATAHQVGAGRQRGEVEAGGAVHLAAQEHAAVEVAEDSAALGLDGDVVGRGVGVDAEGCRGGGAVDADGTGFAVDETHGVGADGDAVFGGDGDDEEGRFGDGVHRLALDADGGVRGLGGHRHTAVGQQARVVDMQGIVEAPLLEPFYRLSADADAGQPGAVDELDVVDRERVVAVAAAGGGVGGEVDQHVMRSGVAVVDERHLHLLPLVAVGRRGGAAEAGHRLGAVEAGVALLVGGAEVVVAVQDGRHLGLRAGIGGIVAHPHIHRVRRAREGEAVVGVRALGVVVVLAACGAHRARVYAAGGHVAVGLDAEDRLGVKGQEVAARGARPAAVAAVVVVRRGQGGKAAVRRAEGVPMGRLGGVAAVPLLEARIGQLILRRGRHRCHQQKQEYDAFLHSALITQSRRTLLCGGTCSVILLPGSLTSPGCRCRWR